MKTHPGSTCYLNYVDPSIPTEPYVFRRLYICLKPLVEGFHVGCRKEEYVVVSDKQKGLEQVINKLLPDITKMNCVQHIYQNFKKEMKGGQLLRDILWEPASKKKKQQTELQPPSTENEIEQQPPSTENELEQQPPTTENEPEPPINASRRRRKDIDNDDDCQVVKVVQAPNGVPAASQRE
ncbi:hypothetical protein LIER_24476 [Lithospermum erythrorhizon]|uniref:MULE transposase domain-containing protein n=1 Tax=Lithospermum erythrorhizon TaxID=34254 RepID=A0AAV3R587_LITER